MRRDLIQGDARAVLRSLPADSIDCVVTSPPYWGLRSYGTEPQVWHGDPACAHEWRPSTYYTERGAGQSSAEAFSVAGQENAARIRKARWRTDSRCARCGAWLGEHGSEPDWRMYVMALVEWAREVRRVLKPTGSFWLNLGDSFSTRGGSMRPSAEVPMRGQPAEADPQYARWSREWAGVPTKSKMLLPHRVAIALEDDGWIVRADIVWDKPNGLPESVKDRVSVTKEYLFHLVKSPRYFFDLDAIREPFSESTHVRVSQRKLWSASFGVNGADLVTPKERSAEPGSGIRSNWDFKSQTNAVPGQLLGGPPEAPLGAFDGPEHRTVKYAHLVDGPHAKDQPRAAMLASFRQRMARKSASADEVASSALFGGLRPRAASLSAFRDKTRAEHRTGGKRLAPEPGEPHAFHPLGKNPGDVWTIPTQPFPDAHFATFAEELVRRPILASCPERVCSACGKPWVRKNERVSRYLAREPSHQPGNGPKVDGTGWRPPMSRTVQLESSCECTAEWHPGVVLDPFAGSGTVGMVAADFGRDFVLVELKAEYVRIARRRLGARLNPLASFPEAP